MDLYGREWNRRELEARIGRIEQLGGARRMMLTEGKEAGMELIRVRTGAGLSYDITPGKGLDISLAEFSGTPVSWQSPNGDVHPSLYEPEGTAWLRTASGGLLMTCGLSNVGNPASIPGSTYGLHGRAHHTPARHVAVRGEWRDNDYEIEVSGKLEETSLFGENLRLTRRIKSRLGENCIRIEDRVENGGFAPSPHMMLYHFNFGFPLMTEHTDLYFPPAEVRPREPNAKLDGYDKWAPPSAGAAERVFYHDLSLGGMSTDEWVEVSVLQPRFPVAGKEIGLRVKLRWQADTLPRLVQWHMPGAGVHVLGLEPANCHVQGMAAEADRGTLLYLNPGEQVNYALELSLETE